MRQTVVDKEREKGKKRKKEIERKEINKKSGKLKKEGYRGYFTLSLYFNIYMKLLCQIFLQNDFNFTREAAPSKKAELFLKELNPPK